jgi:hypothetical protein
MRNERYLKVGFSADFLDEQRRLIFPDIGLSLLDSEPNIAYEFLTEYDPEYTCLPEKPYGRLILGQPVSTTAGQRACARLLFCSSRCLAGEPSFSRPTPFRLFSLIVQQKGNQAATRT